jgi:hypothetical protein
MFATGAGGLEVALAMAGKPLYLNMPQVVRVELTGELPDWVSAKDVVLEMLRRFGVKGGVGKVFEYYGPGLDGAECDGPPRDRQHGHRDGRDDLRVPLRRRGQTLSGTASSAATIGESCSPMTVPTTTSTSRSISPPSSR